MMWNSSESLLDGENETSLFPQLISRSLRNAFLMANGSFTLLVALAALPANFLNMLIFWSLGLDSSVNINFFALSAADFSNACMYAFIAVIWLDMSEIIQLPLDLTNLQYLSGPLIICMSTYGSWLTAVTSTERCFSVRFPLKVKHIFSRKITSGLIASMLVVQVIIMITSLALVRWRVTALPGSERSKVILDTSDAERDVYITLLFWGSSLPASICFCVIVMSTVFLAMTLRQRERWLQTLPGQRNESVERNKRLAATVVAISAIYITCLLPGVAIVGVFTMIPNLDILNIQNEHMSLVLISFVSIFQTVSLMANIFIYYSMNSRYKQCFKRMFCFACNKIRTRNHHE